MAKVVVPAARARQGSLTLYSTSIRVADLVVPGFYNVDTLDPADKDKGFQRLLNSARAKKLADYIMKGQDAQDAFLPTSIFLATDKPIYLDEQRNTIEIDTNIVGPFSVVDGQHRLEGLKMAAERDKRVLSFEVPVNIAVSLSRLAQMCHFYIVNTTQKSVDKSVEQRIVARLTEALSVEDVPTLPRWMQRMVEGGDVDKALKLVDHLNTTPGSPWLNKIRMANEELEDSTINQRSFVKAVVKYVLNANNPLSTLDFDKQKKVFLNYWSALVNVIDDGDASTFYKYNGVELFCRFSVPFFVRLSDRGSFTVDTMTNGLKACFDAMEGEYAGVGHPEFWHKGGKAGMLNQAAINVIVQQMAAALHKSSMAASIEV